MVAVCMYDTEEYSVDVRFILTKLIHFDGNFASVINISDRPLMEFND